MSKQEGNIHRQALLIGPSYNLLPAKLQLDGTTTDLEIINEVISRQPFKFDHVKEITGEDATKKNILSCLADVTVRAEDGSVLLVYYSGHGYRWTGGPRSLNWDEGLVPAGITREDIKSGMLYSKCITGGDIKDYLIELSKKNVFVTIVFDCCFSGRMYRGPDLDKANFNCTKAKEVTLAALLKIEEREKALGGFGNSKDASDSGKFTDETEPKRKRRKLTEGWFPHKDDKFFYLSACMSIEKAWEGFDFWRQKYCGYFTSSFGHVLEKWSETKGRLSYKALYSLIQREFKGENTSFQTPQMEGANLDTVLFGNDFVPQSSKLVDVGDVVTENSHTTVQLLAGHLQILQDGEYDIYEPTVEDSHITQGRNNRLWVGAIDVNEKDIALVTASGHVIEQEEGRKIMPGCKAHLRQSHKVRTGVVIVSSSDENSLKEKLVKTQMFRVWVSSEYTELEHEVLLQRETIDGEEHWCARVNGRMIVPPVCPNQDEDTMALNLAKYFRYHLALKQPPSNDRLLLNVKFKVSKLEKVKPFGHNPSLRNERLKEARTKLDLYAEHADNPNSPRPRLQAHKMTKKLIKGKLKDTFVDETGDAIAVQVTNNEEVTIHVLLLMFQLDGSIVVMHPPGKGASTPLSSGASLENIFRINIPEHALQKLTQPDPNIEAATEGVDTIILYAMSDPFDMGPLAQPPLELSDKRKGKGNASTSLNPLKSYLEALKERSIEAFEESDSGWLTEKREFVVVGNRN